MAEWKDFSLRNGKKFNILDAMWYLALIMISLLFPVSVFAQNTQLSAASAPSSTVTVEAKVVEIILNDEHRKGIDWEAIVSDFHSLQLKKEDNPIWADKRYQLSIGEVSSEDYAVLLEALDTVGHFMQNDFSQTSLLKNEAQSIDVSPDPKKLPNINLELMWMNSPAGIAKLKITPELGIIIKDSSNASNVVSLKGQTELDLKDNTTIIIGGLMHEQEISKTQKLPLLGDLPLVGLVFRKQGRLMQKTETIVFLTIHTNAVQTSGDQ